MQYDDRASNEFEAATQDFVGDFLAAASAQVTKTDAMGLLQRLVADDGFRQRMEADPVLAFSEYGFMIDRATAPATVALPSKEVLKQTAEVLGKQLDATSGWVVFCR